MIEMKKGEEINLEEKKIKEETKAAETIQRFIRKRMLLRQEAIKKLIKLGFTTQEVQKILVKNPNLININDEKKFKKKTLSTIIKDKKNKIADSKRRTEMMTKIIKKDNSELLEEVKKILEKNKQIKEKNKQQLQILSPKIKKDEILNNKLQNLSNQIKNPYIKKILNQFSKNKKKHEERKNQEQQKKNKDKNVTSEEIAAIKLQQAKQENKNQNNQDLDKVNNNNNNNKTNKKEEVNNKKKENNLNNNNNNLQQQENKKLSLEERLKIAQEKDPNATIDSQGNIVDEKGNIISLQGENVQQIQQNVANKQTLNNVANNMNQTNQKQGDKNLQNVIAVKNTIQNVVIGDSKSQEQNEQNQKNKNDQKDGKYNTEIEQQLSNISKALNNDTAAITIDPEIQGYQETLKEQQNKTRIDRMRN